MTADVEGSICDAEGARLLPWFVNGRLNAADAERVAQHLAHCAICRADAAEQRSLRATIKDDGPVEYAPQAGLAKTLARIDELTRDAMPAPDVPRIDRRASHARRYGGLTQWLAAAVVVQAVGLGVLGGSFIARTASDGAGAPYETLSTPTATSSRPCIRAVFSTSMTIGELKALLAAQHLLIVAGPTDAGVFTLGVMDAAHEPLSHLLSGLRADPHVQFAEPLASAGAVPR